MFEDLYLDYFENINVNILLSIIHIIKFYNINFII